MATITATALATMALMAPSASAQDGGTTPGTKGDADTTQPAQAAAWQTELPDGTKVEWERNTDTGEWEAGAKTTLTSLPDTLDAVDRSATADPAKPATVTLSKVGTDTPATVEGNPGVLNTTGTIRYAGKDTSGNTFSLTLTVDATSGTEVKAQGDGQPVPFTQNKDTGKWEAQVTTSLDTKTGQPGPVTLTDGTKLATGDGAWGAMRLVPDGKGGWTTSREATVTTSITTKDADGKAHTWDVTVHATATTATTWGIGGQPDAKLSDDGTLTLHATSGKEPPATLTAESNDGRSITLTPAKVEKTTPGTLFGTTHVEGDATYTPTGTIPDGTPKTDVTIHYSYDTGTETTLSDGTRLTRGGDGLYTASMDAKLSDGTDGKPIDTPSVDTVTFSDGTTGRIDWNTAKRDTVERDGAVHIILTATITGTRGEGEAAQKWAVTVTASRTRDTHLKTLAVAQNIPGQPEPTIHDIGFREDVTSYTLTLPHDAINSSLSLTETHGVDAKVTTDARLNRDGSRTLTLTADTTTYTVTVRFQAADIQPDSPAKLTGIWVNPTGQPTKGQLIADWDPNRLDYTLTIGENDPSPYILPTWDEASVSVTAGDITQNADSARQEWRVTSADGKASRVYSVTTVRTHAWRTAAESFKPSDPVEQEATREPDGPQDTSLDTHGYLLDGVYTPIAGDGYTIPQGGVFAYQPKKGQSASVTAQRVSGMTWRYTVGVLAPDHTSFANTTITVTYLTEPTHRAQLDGIAVNGRDIDGFQPDRTDWEVAVDDPAQWTVSPKYDKTTGMSVTTAKTGTMATITVVSADGLARRTYRVHVTAKKAGLAGLAATGVSMSGLTGAIGMMLAAVAVQLGMMRRRTR